MLEPFILLRWSQDLDKRGAKYAMNLDTIKHVLWFYVNVVATKVTYIIEAPWPCVHLYFPSFPKYLSLEEYYDIL